MKKIILLLGLLISAFYSAQIGVKTTNPLATFHIDGSHNNPISGSPSAAQASDDFVIDAFGKVGVGTVIPAQKLQIVGNNNDHPLLISQSQFLSSASNMEQLAIDDQGNVGVKSSVGVLASVFTIQSEVRGLDMTNGSSNVNIPISENNMIFNTLSSVLGVDNVGGVAFNYITIPASGAYEIQVFGSFNCSTAGIWGMNLQMRKGIVSGGAINYPVVETRRMASTFVGTTNALPGKIYGEYIFSAGDRINFRLAAGKTYSGTTPDCGSVNISGPSSGIKVVITKID